MEGECFFCFFFVFVVSFGCIDARKAVSGTWCVNTIGIDLCFFLLLVFFLSYLCVCVCFEFFEGAAIGLDFESISGSWGSPLYCCVILIR